tara:strand:+ start:980 stop:1285 length:306 start_codon:yes stop_codon:yes gene_type:complete
MIMIENDTIMFMKLCEDFVTSSKVLRDASALCDGDPIKQEMISFIVPDFMKMCARSEGIKISLQSERFGENREFIIDEMKNIIKENLNLARKIEDKLGCLR